jgi:hypothetical protein
MLPLLRLTQRQLVRTSQLVPQNQLRCYHTTMLTQSTSSSASTDLENLRMLPEFVQAEEHFTKGDFTSATRSLERVQDICDSSMGETSPMSLAVHSLVLTYLTSSFSSYTSTSNLQNIAQQAIKRNTDNADDLTTRSFLRIVMGSPELVIESTNDLNHAHLHLPRHQQHLLFYRGVALATISSIEEARTTFEHIQNTFDASNSQDESVEVLKVQTLHNLGALDLMVAQKERDLESVKGDNALSKWKAALDMINGSTISSNTLKACEAELLCNVGSLQTERGDPNEGIACLSRAVSLLGELNTEKDQDGGSNGSSNNGSNDLQHPNIVRPLTLLGRAHHADGRAVSAEGYFRNALGLLDGSSSTAAPTLQLQHVETLRMYASLMVDWEQRRADYEVQINAANDMHKIMVEAQCTAMPMCLTLPWTRGYM